MDLWVVIARLAIAVVLLSAAVLKFKDWTSWRMSIEGLPFIGRFGKPAATALPVVELVIGILLLVPATVWLGAVGASVLFCTFVAFVAAMLITGKGGDCRCFGNLRPSKLSGQTVARNVVLLGVTAIPLARGPDYGHATVAAIWRHAWDEPNVALMWLLVALVGVLVFLQFQVMRQQGRILLRLEDVERSTNGTSRRNLGVSPTPAKLDVGNTAPFFVGRDINRAPKSLKALQQSGAPLVLVFLDVACGSCRELLPEVKRWQLDYAAYFTVTVVARSNALDDDGFRDIDHALLIFQEDREISELYGSFGTPSAVAIDSEGRILAPLIYGSERIRVMVRSVIASPSINRESGPRVAVEE